jgi:hypothetical protein
MKDLIYLRLKWKPILMCRQSISEKELDEYNLDVNIYKANNPDWQNINLLHI